MFLNDAEHLAVNNNKAILIRWIIKKQPFV